MSGVLLDAFNSLLEMHCPRLGCFRSLRDSPFNSLFEMLRFLVFDFCKFLSVSVVVLEFAVVGFVLVLWGLFVCGGVGGCGSCLGGDRSRRRLADLCCTTFYKLDLRFT